MPVEDTRELALERVGEADLVGSCADTGFVFPFEREKTARCVSIRAAVVHET
ncbi:MAG TPA: hypothetical protein VFR43_00525 [Gaiellaceae bacterium]|nr:hypothetical protein [Gaiellaceae bacterium]